MLLGFPMGPAAGPVPQAPARLPNGSRHPEVIQAARRKPSSEAALNKGKPLTAYRTTGRLLPNVTRSMANPVASDKTTLPVSLRLRSLLLGLLIIGPGGSAI
jgi:hypothetical protein